jgi:hypothetical protein
MFVLANNKVDGDVKDGDVKDDIIKQLICSVS